MSRLNSAIRRLAAQRDCLESAADHIRAVPGLELGLGNGRTYDHLRDLFPDREIFAFDRQIGAHPSCVPKESHMILGDIFETLPAAPTWIGGQVALVHSDIGCGNLAETSAVCDALPEMLAPILASGAIVVSDQELRTPNWQKLPLPAAVAPGRYHMWRVAAQNDAEHWLP